MKLPYYKTENCQLFKSDNLQLLGQIPDNYINLIYCDILYGTGRNFGDYQDLKPDRKIIEKHYLPRLVEMKRVLKVDGSIYLQMDKRISHWVRILMDDIFDYKNFKNEIIWAYKSGGGGKNNYPDKKDHIVFYTKSNNYTFNSQTQKIRMKHNYGFSQIRDRKGKDENGFYYLSACKSVWDDIDINSKNHSKNNHKKLYETQKPKGIAERIIETSSHKNDLVADFYMGSGTTAEAALETGRKFMGCDIGEKACLITKQRVSKYE